MKNTKDIWWACEKLLAAYNAGTLWYMKMPEDENPWFREQDREHALSYFSLPMALNYQRNSYKLRESALASYHDKETKHIYDLDRVTHAQQDELRELLVRHKLALQPNKHSSTRKTIASTVFERRWSWTWLLSAANHDFLVLQETVQKEHKKWFPYLSWPKIFNYWSSIIQVYAFSPLLHSDYIDIAPDTHVIQASLKLGVITKIEALQADREKIASRRRTVLTGSGISPIQMHSPLWFRSRNNFSFDLESL